MPRLLLTLLLLVPSPSRSALAVKPDCLINFATVAEGEGDGHDLVVDAYRKLFEQLDRGRLPGRVLREMKDPFALTEAPEHGDLSALKQNLARLHELVRAKHWDTPELRRLLRTELERLSVARDDAGRRQQEAVQGVLSRVVPFQSTRPLTFSPNRRWVIAEGTSASGSDVLNVYDVVNNQTVAVPVPPGISAGAHFTPDGTRLLFPETDSIESVPFREGTIDWAARKAVVAKHDLPGTRMGLYPTTSPEKFFLAAWGQLFLVDLAAGSVAKTNIPQGKDARLNDSGSIPGTDTAFFVLENWMYEGTVQAPGHFPSPLPVTKWKSNPGSVYFSADGKKILSNPHSTSRQAVLQTRGGNEETVQTLVSLHTGRADFGADIMAIATHPTKNEGFVFVRDAKSTRIECFDLETGKGKWEHTVPFALQESPTMPPHHPPIVTPDGKHLMLKTADGDLNLINLPLLELQKAP